MEWQPIDTAPKDGRRVILFTVWSETPDYPCPSFSEVQIGYWRHEDGWIMENIGEPTYWMPIPKSPEVK